MHDNPKAPEGHVADAVAGNWVDHRAPAWTRPYLRLSRADRPIGTWLLYIPCIWAILLAALVAGEFRVWDLWLILGCGIGAFLMRGAGCTWNDITDRKIDASVERTRSRPIPSGQVSVKQALIWLTIQCVISFVVLLSFGSFAVLIGISSLGFVAIYPFAKRFTWWPQVFLGLAFNWGALLGWAAHSGTISMAALLLYVGGITWTLFYDTIYAHQDVDDDALIGVKSTARLFGENSPKWLLGFSLLATVILWASIMSTDLGLILKIVAGVGVLGFLAHLMKQLKTFDANNGAVLLRLFRSNRDAGLIIVLFFAIAQFL